MGNLGKKRLHGVCLLFAAMLMGATFSLMTARPAHAEWVLYDDLFTEWTEYPDLGSHSGLADAVGVEGGVRTQVGSDEYGPYYSGASTAATAVAWLYATGTNGVGAYNQAQAGPEIIGGFDPIWRGDGPPTGYTITGSGMRTSTANANMPAADYPSGYDSVAQANNSVAECPEDTSSSFFLSLGSPEVIYNDYDTDTSTEMLTDVSAANPFQSRHVNCTAWQETLIVTQAQAERYEGDGGYDSICSAAAYAYVRGYWLASASDQCMGSISIAGGD